MFEVFSVAMSIHSNSHLGISLMAMTHATAATPNLNYACDTHYPWQEDEVIQSGRITFHKGSVMMLAMPGLGAEIDPAHLKKLYRQYLDCGVRNDLAQMRKYDPGFPGVFPRF